MGILLKLLLYTQHLLATLTVYSVLPFSMSSDDIHSPCVWVAHIEYGFILVVIVYRGNIFLSSFKFPELKKEPRPGTVSV